MSDLWDELFAEAKREGHVVAALAVMFPDGRCFNVGCAVAEIELGDPERADQRVWKPLARQVAHKLHFLGEKS